MQRKRVDAENATKDALGLKCVMNVPRKCTSASVRSAVITVRLGKREFVITVNPIDFIYSNTLKSLVGNVHILFTRMLSNSTYYMRFTTSQLIKCLTENGNYTEDELGGKTNEELLQMVNQLQDLAATSVAI